MQTQTSNTLNNSIMKAGSKDRPSMLAPGNYVQWKSRIKRFIDTKPNHELIHYCLKNPPYQLGWIDKEILISEGSPITRTERLKQGESINVQDLKTNLYWESGKFTSQDGESLESYYSRFYKMMNELIRNQCKVTNHQVNVQFLLQLQPEWQRFVTLVKQSKELKTVSYHKLYDILKQHQHEANEIRAERIARVANPLALVAQQQTVYHPQTHPTHYTQNSSTRSQQAATRNRGKAIRDDTDDDELEDQELEAHYMYMAQLQEVSPDTADSGPIFDDEPLQNVSNDDHYNVLAIKSAHPEQSKSVHDTYHIEQDAHTMIIDSLDMSYDRVKIDQNDDDNDLAKERELLSSLIQKLKCEIDESKNHNKFLETSKKVLVKN
nr:hypothetical protein [Tanacetum cinerariifolium]